MTIKALMPDKYKVIIGILSTALLAFMVAFANDLAGRTTAVTAINATLQSRTAVLEQIVQNQKEQLDRIETDQKARFDRIESKIDRIGR